MSSKFTLYIYTYIYIVCIFDGIIDYTKVKMNWHVNWLNGEQLQQPRTLHTAHGVCVCVCWHSHRSIGRSSRNLLVSRKTCVECTHLSIWRLLYCGMRWTPVNVTYCRDIYLYLHSGASRVQLNVQREHTHTHIYTHNMSTCTFIIIILA